MPVDAEMPRPINSEVAHLRRSIVRDMSTGRQPSRREAEDQSTDLASMIATIQETAATIDNLSEKVRHYEEDLYDERQVTSELRARVAESERELAAAARMLGVEKERVAALEQEIEVIVVRSRIAEEGSAALKEHVQALAAVLKKSNLLDVNSRRLTTT